MPPSASAMKSQFGQSLDGKREKNHAMLGKAEAVRLAVEDNFFDIVP